MEERNNMKRHYYLAIMGCYSPQYGYEEVSAYELNERKQALADLKEYRIASPNVHHTLKRRWELQEESTQ